MAVPAGTGEGLHPGIRAGRLLRDGFRIAVHMIRVSLAALGAFPIHIIVHVPSPCFLCNMEIKAAGIRAALQTTYSNIAIRC